jgi:hypothetical protein
VREIEVDGLVQGEGYSVVVERGVDLRARVAEGVVLEAGERFLDVAYTDCATCGRLKGTTAGEVKVEGVFEADPLVVGEEVAEGGVAVGDLLLLVELVGRRAQDLRFHRDTWFERRRCPQ